ncbi:MAG: hypothetical protein ACK5FV_06565, partial [Bacteroidota bacterium]
MKAGFHYRLFTAGLAVISFVTGLSFNFREAAPAMHLSDYRFFTGNLSDLNPAEGVFEYEVNAPLFTDYAEQKRFIDLPPG